MIGLQFACEIEGRMNGHAKNMHLKKSMKSIASKYLHFFFYLLQ